MRALPLRRAALIVAAGVTLTVLPGVALAAPAPGPAPTPPATTSLCPDDSLCSWPQRDYAGEVTEISDAANGGCRELAHPATSAINDSGRTAVFYTSPGCVGGVVIGVEPGRKAPSFPEAASVRLRVPTGAAPGTVPGTTAGSADGTQAAPTQDSTETTDSSEATGDSAGAGGESTQPASGRRSGAPTG